MSAIGFMGSCAVTSTLSDDTELPHDASKKRQYGRNLSMTTYKDRDRERREHRRYLAKHRLFAVVRSNDHQLAKIENMSKGEIAFALLRSKPSKMGEIVEISQGGLTFHYIANEGGIKALDELDIIFAEKDFHLSGLPFKEVEDAEVIDDSPFNALAMKRFTVKFRELTPKQKRKIEHLLSNYTTGEVTGAKGGQA
jgi:hypothetical protein